MRRALTGPLSFGLSKAIASPEGVGDIITSIFADGTDGFYFDFSKTDRLFQNLTLTPADDAGENIYLGLESHSWAGRTYAQELAVQAEKVTNGGFDADANWTKGAGFTISGGTLNAAAGSGSNAEQAGILTVGKWYRVSYEVTAYTAGSVQLLIGSGTAALSRSSVGVGSGIFQCTGNTSLYVNKNATFAGSIDNISIKEIPGNHGLQATAAAQPKWQTGGAARFDGSDDNLLTTLKFGAAGTILLRLKPTSVPALVVALGAQAASSDRVWVGVDPSGVAGRFANGAQMSSGVSRLNVDGTIGLRWDGTTVDLLVDGAVNVSQAQSGSATTLVSPAIGAFNANGSISNAMAGDFYYALIIKKALSAAEIAAITNLWGT